MSLFPNASNFVLNNSPLTLTDITVNNSPGLTGIDILFEASVPEAAHDSSARHPPPRCFPGTRGQYIEDIVDWALPAINDTPLPIYWLKGPAGVGKSAVAQTCAEKLKRQRKLGAAFFFSINRWSKDTVSIKNKNEQNRFFTSIAYQLSAVYPIYRDLLNAKIRRDRSLVSKAMESQFWELIVQPLQELEEKGLGTWKRIPVLVDGLDECESREAQREIIEIVTAAARDGTTPLCWAFFSRPEPHIEAVFSKSSISPHCHKAVLPVSHNADGDIELYLKAGFEDIIQRLNIVMDCPWPSDSDMKQIVRAANGLFIYAKTVLRFVGQPDSLNPEELLRAIITVISNRGNQSGIANESVFAELDAFYMLIMQYIPAKMLFTIHRVLAFLCNRSFSGAIVIANFLGLSRVELEAACNQMGAVVHFQRQQEPLELDPAVDTTQSFLHTNPRLTVRASRVIFNSLGGSISFHHKSFKDFLLDPLRSGVYCVNAILRDVEMQRHGLALQRNFFLCWQGSELVRAPGAPASTSILSYPYVNELVNSCVEAFIDYIRPSTISLGADFDFRKEHYIALTLIQPMFIGQGTTRTTLYKCASFAKYIHRTKFSWIQPGEFSKFDVVGFKKGIKRQQQRNIAQPYRPIPPSLEKPRGRVESGLYVIGLDSKSIFWYWVINYDLETYQQFQTIDLAEGERVYQVARAISIVQ